MGYHLKLVASASLLLLVLRDSILYSRQKVTDQVGERTLALANRNLADSDFPSAVPPWGKFRGFMAEIEVELAGQRSMGRVVVEESGHLFVEQLPDAHANWVRSNLACLIEVQFPFRDTASRGWLSQSRAHELKNSKTQAIRWIRIDGLDLLDSIKISTVESAGFQGTRPIVCSIKLSNHQILGKSGTQRSNARSNVKR